MKDEDLKALSKEFHENAHKLMADFEKTFRKWYKKDSRLTIVSTIAIPLSTLSNMAQSNNNMSKAMPDLPDVLNRYLMPFNKIKMLWGVINDDEFFKEYGKAYQDQFEEFFINEQQKKTFKEWYEAGKK